jgi:hypothetical protein
MSTEGVDCTLFVEDFTGVSTAPSALLDGKWKCRKCGKLAADHPHGQHDGKLRCCSRILALFNCWFVEATNELTAFLLLL